MIRHPLVVDVLRELVCRPLLLAAHFCEVELADGVPIERSLVSVDHRIMAVDSNRLVIVRN